MERRIIKDTGVFEERFLPSQAIGRNDHIREILNHLEFSKDEKLPRNIYVHGPPGSGKSTVIRKILSDRYDKRHVYVNCWSNRTAHKVISEILKQREQIIHGKESTTELTKKFTESPNKPIVCLDEFDQLKDTKILYDLARSGCTVFLISNDPYSPGRIDARIRSSLPVHEIMFPKYGKEELMSILKDRSEEGLHHDAISEDLLSHISEYCEGDARAAIQVLRNSAFLAESKQLPLITQDEVNSSKGAIRKYRRSYLLRKLNGHQRVIYDILKERKSMWSGDLFAEYRKRVSDVVTSRSYRNYMARMVELGLVSEKNSDRWKKYEIVE